MIHKILLVDDDQMIAEDFQRTIAGESDLELTWASSGAKAISEVQKNPRGFSVIVMDYLMPDMSGAETRTYNEYQTRACPHLTGPISGR